MSLYCNVSKILLVISKNVKRSRDPEHSPLVMIYHACTSNHQYEAACPVWYLDLPTAKLCLLFSATKFLKMSPVTLTTTYYIITCTPMTA